MFSSKINSREENYGEKEIKTFIHIFNPVGGGWLRKRKRYDRKSSQKFLRGFLSYFVEKSSLILWKGRDGEISREERREQQKKDKHNGQNPANADRAWADHGSRIFIYGSTE